MTFRREPMMIVPTVVASWLVTAAAFGQTVRVHPNAQFMPLRVIDATGKLVAGTVAESTPAEPLAVTLMYSSPLTTNKGDSFTLRIKAAPSEGPVGYRWAQLPNDIFYFESSNCTGQAYVESPGPMPGRRLALLDYETNFLYLSEPDPTVVAKTYQSLRHPLDSCDDNLGGQFFLAVAIDPVLDMDDFFTLPFAIR